MRATTPTVFGPIARPQLDWDQIYAYLDHLDRSLGTIDDGAVKNWFNRAVQRWTEGGLRWKSDSQTLVEIMGRLCYRSWAPRLNPNVTKVREDQGQYLLNILSSRHGSVLEHATYSFIFADVSRVFTHELITHRVGIGKSQESMRYVRLDDIPFEHPDFVKKDPELLVMANDLLEQMEQFQAIMADATDLDEEGVDFHTKKTITSGMRRYAPDGVATTIGWSANVRILRHVIELRTSPGAEEEIRRVFYRVGEIMRQEAPLLFQDFKSIPVENTATPMWVPKYSKV